MAWMDPAVYYIHVLGGGKFRSRQASDISFLAVATHTHVCTRHTQTPRDIHVFFVSATRDSTPSDQSAEPPDACRVHA